MRRSPKLWKVPLRPQQASGNLKSERPAKPYFLPSRFLTARKNQCEAFRLIEEESNVPGFRRLDHLAIWPAKGRGRLGEKTARSLEKLLAELSFACWGFRRELIYRGSELGRRVGIRSCKERKIPLKAEFRSFRVIAFGTARIVDFDQVDSS